MDDPYRLTNITEIRLIFRIKKRVQALVRAGFIYRFKTRFWPD